MPDIGFRFAWRGRDPEVLADARRFWQSLGGVVRSEEAEERERELCAAAYSGGDVIAVSTATITDYPRLGGSFAFYRTAVAPSFRRQSVAAKLCAYSRDKLAQWSRENPEEKVKGLFIAVQSDDLFRERRHLPVISKEGLDFIFVGYGQTGFQIRVVWFAHATVE